MSGDDRIARVTRVDCDIAPYDWAFPREERNRIDTHWAARCQAAPALFDGRVLLMRDLSVEAEVVSATCFETSYKAFLSWRDFGCPGAPLYNMFGMAALQAADGPFMLGLMSEGTSAAGRLYFPAGTPEPFDIDARGRIDFEANVRRELQEETGLGTDDVVFGSDWTIVVDGSRVACMKPVQSTETAAELRRRLSVFNAMQSEPELADLIPIARQADYDARIPGFMIRYLDWALADQTL